MNTDQASGLPPTGAGMAGGGGDPLPATPGITETASEVVVPVTAKPVRDASSAAAGTAVPADSCSAVEFRVRRPDAPVRRLRLSGPRYTFGAGDGCSIRLDDPTLRPVHAVLVRDSQRILLRAYSVPIEVNGERVTEATLRVGDVVRLGSYRFELLTTHAPSAPKESPPEPTVEVPAATLSGTGRENRPSQTRDAGEEHPDANEVAVAGNQQAALSQLRQELQLWRSRENELERQQSDFRRRESRCAERESRIEDREAELRERESRLWTLSEELQVRERQLEEGASDAKTLERVVAEKESELRRLEDLSETRSREFEALARNRSEEFERARADLQRARDEALAQRDQAQADRDAAIEQRTESETHRAQLQLERDRLRSQREQLQAERDEVKAERDEVERERQQLAAECERHESARLTIEEKLTESEATRKRVEAERGQLEARLEQLTEELRETRLQYEAGQTQTFETDELAEQLRDQVQDLRDTVRQAREESERLRNEYEQAASSQGQAEAAIRQLQTTATEAEQQLERDRRNWQVEAEQLRESVNRLSHALAEANAELSRLRSSNVEMVERLRHLQQQRDQAYQEAQEIADQAQRECDAVDRKLEEAETARTAAEAEAEQLRTEAEGARAEAEQVRAESEQLQAALDDLQSETREARLIAERSQLGEPGSDAEIELARSEAERAQAEAERAQAAAERAQAEAEEARLDAERARTEADEARLEADRARAETDARPTSAALDTLRDELDQATRQLESLNQEYEAAVAELQQWRAAASSSAPDSVSREQAGASAGHEWSSASSTVRDPNGAGDKPETLESRYAELIDDAETPNVNQSPQLPRSGGTTADDEIEAMDQFAPEASRGLAHDLIESLNRDESPDPARGSDVALESGAVRQSEVAHESEPTGVEAQLHEATLPEAEAELPSNGADDDSIEAYMNRLLQRVQGGVRTAVGAPLPKPQPQPAKPKEHSVREQPSSEATSATKPATPSADEPYLPRSQAPERGQSLSAMRELANQSARSAITRSVHVQARNTQMKAMLKLAAAGVAAATGAASLIWIDGVIRLVGVTAASIVSCFFLFEAAALFLEGRRRVAMAEAGEVQELLDSDDSGDLQDSGGLQNTIETEPMSADTAPSEERHFD